MQSIAFFTSRLSFQRMETIISHFSSRCSITPFIIDDYRELNEKYISVRDAFDGFLFSGWMLYAFLSATTRLDKPYAYFYAQEGDYYRTMVQACAEHPEIPLSDFFSDRAGGEHGFTDVMPPENHCMFLDTNRLAIGYQKLAEGEDTTVVNEFLVSKYMEAIIESKGKLVISGFARLKDRVEALGIPFYYIHPGTDAVVMTIERLLNRLESGELTNVFSVNGMVSTEETSLDIVWDIISKYVWQKGYDVVITKENDVLRLVVSNPDFLLLTEEQTDCYLSHELLNHGILDFSIGWGIGYNLTIARKNSLKALSMSRRFGKASAFVVSENNVFVGPLLGNKALKFSSTDDEAIYAMSYQFDISRLHVKQICALLEKTHNNVYTGETLAKELNLHPRSARRILAKLVKSGGAEVVKESGKRSRGRPELVYRITLQ